MLQNFAGNLLWKKELRRLQDKLWRREDGITRFCDDKNGLSSDIVEQKEVEGDIGLLIFTDIAHNLYKICKTL